MGSTCHRLILAVALRDWVGGPDSIRARDTVQLFFRRLACQKETIENSRRYSSA